MQLPGKLNAVIRQRYRQLRRGIRIVPLVVGGHVQEGDLAIIVTQILLAPADRFLDCIDTNITAEGYFHISESIQHSALTTAKIENLRPYKPVTKWGKLVHNRI